MSRRLTGALLLVVLAGCSVGMDGQPTDAGTPAGVTSPSTSTVTATDAPRPDTERRAAEHTPTAACEPGTPPPDGHGDTSGDGIPDAWLVAGEAPDGTPLPDGDPCRMNVYLQVSETGNASLPPGMVAETERAFAELPVRNPDGSTGIDLHVVEGPNLDENVTFSRGDLDALRAEYYRNLTGERAGVYHLALVVRFDEGTKRRYSGIAETPGRMIVIQHNPPSGSALLVHEILHNLVGELPPSVDGRCDRDPVHYCHGGYLDDGPVGGAPEFYAKEGDQRYLPAEIADHVESAGFATTVDGRTNGSTVAE